MLSMAVPQSTTSQPQSAIMKAMVPPPPWSTLPSSPICQATPPSFKDLTDFLDGVAVGVIAAGFTASPRVFGQGKAIAAENYLSPVTSGNMGSRQLLTSPESISLFSMVS